MSTKKSMNFKIGDRVLTGKNSGTIIGRATFLESNPQYFVRYVDGFGNLSENWFYESSLTSD